jgi:hypothetical protein
VEKRRKGLHLNDIGGTSDDRRKVNEKFRSLFEKDMHQVTKNKETQSLYQITSTIPRNQAG